MERAVFWDVTPRTLIGKYWRFRGTCCRHHWTILSSPWKCHLLLIHVYCRLLNVAYAQLTHSSALVYAAADSAENGLAQALIIFRIYLLSSLPFFSSCFFYALLSSFAPVLSRLSHSLLNFPYFIHLPYCFPPILSQKRSFYLLPFLFSPSFISSRISFSNQYQC
jgi:hypothetical protein